MDISDPEIPKKQDILIHRGMHVVLLYQKTD